MKELLRVATTEYKPDLKKIVKEKECQNSHGLSNMHDNKLLVNFFRYHVGV